MTLRFSFVYYLPGAVEKAAVSYWLLAVGYGAAPAMPFHTGLIGMFNLLTSERAGFASLAFLTRIPRITRV